MEHCICKERKCCRNAEYLSNFDYKDLVCALADKINMIYANNNRNANPLNEDMEGLVLMTQIGWFLSGIKSEFDKKELHRILDGNRYKKDIPRDLHCSDLIFKYESRLGKELSRTDDGVISYIVHRKKEKDSPELEEFQRICMEEALELWGVKNGNKDNKKEENLGDGK